MALHSILFRIAKPSGKKVITGGIPIYYLVVFHRCPRRSSALAGKLKVLCIDGSAGLWLDRAAGENLTELDSFFIFDGHWFLF